jgi:hypothetical protein
MMQLWVEIEMKSSSRKYYYCYSEPSSSNEVDMGWYDIVAFLHHIIIFISTCDLIASFCRRQTYFCGPPNTLIKYDQYLAFTNEDMTHEILANNEGLEQAVKI